MLGVTCAACSAPLTPGARFCHRCGTPAGAGAGAGTSVRTLQPTPVVGQRTILPWVVAGAGALALVILIAAQQGKRSPGDPATELGPAVPLAGTGARAPDISTMTPRERADRLYDRVMRLVDEGKADSATFFSSMAVGAYESLGALDNDLRYDYGRMAEVAGELDLAKAQADSILMTSPDHLLGLVLAARLAERRGDNAEHRRLLNRLSAVQAAELAKGLEEYTRHRADIDAALRPRS